MFWIFVSLYALSGLTSIYLRMFGILLGDARSTYYLDQPSRLQIQV